MNPEQFDVLLLREPLRRHRLRPRARASSAGWASCPGANIGDDARGVRGGARHRAGHRRQGHREPARRCMLSAAMMLDAPRRDAAAARVRQAVARVLGRARRSRATWAERRPPRVRSALLRGAMFVKARHRVTLVDRRRRRPRSGRRHRSRARGCWSANRVGGSGRGPSARSSTTAPRCLVPARSRSAETGSRSRHGCAALRDRRIPMSNAAPRARSRHAATARQSASPARAIRDWIWW